MSTSVARIKAQIAAANARADAAEAKARALGLDAPLAHEREDAEIDPLLVAQQAMCARRPFNPAQSNQRDDAEDADPIAAAMAAMHARTDGSRRADERGRAPVEVTDEDDGEDPITAASRALNSRGVG